MRGTDAIVHSRLIVGLAIAVFCYIIIDIDIDGIDVRPFGKGNGFVDVLYLEEVGEEVVGKAQAAAHVLAFGIFVGISLHLLALRRLRLHRHSQEEADKQDDVWYNSLHSIVQRLMDFCLFCVISSEMLLQIYNLFLIYHLSLMPNDLSFPAYHT